MICARIVNRLRFSILLQGLIHHYHFMADLQFKRTVLVEIILIYSHGLHTLPRQVRPSDYKSDLDNRYVWGLYEKEGVGATWIFIMQSPGYWLLCGGHT